MYCKNCGNALNIGDNVCTNCGTSAGQGSNHCSNCGTQATPGANVCIACGQPLNSIANANVFNGNPNVVIAKSRIAAGILGILLGVFGAHNFYLGYTKKAVIQLGCTILGFILSCIGIGALIVFGIEVWGIVEGVFILTGKVNVDANGNPLTN